MRRKTSYQHVSVVISTRQKSVSSALGLVWELDQRHATEGAWRVVAKSSRNEVGAKFLF